MIDKIESYKFYLCMFQRIDSSRQLVTTKWYNFCKNSNFLEDVSLIQMFLDWEVTFINKTSYWYLAKKFLKKYSDKTLKPPIYTPEENPEKTSD